IDTLHDNMKSKEEKFNETTILNFKDLENGKPFNICENSTYSQLFKVATERVIPESKKISTLPTINTLSVSSSAPSISELERISLSQLSQCPTIKLPSLSASQLSEMFPSQTSQYNFIQNSSSFDSSSTQTISRFNNDNDNDTEMISEEEKERLRIEEEKAREAQKRQQFKEMVLKHKEQKTIKKRKNVM
ncbi:15503_t:CDS:2, partial [Dentiscutata erythropus]